MKNADRAMTRTAVAFFALAAAACASSRAKEDGYNALLQKIAADCKPLIIGNDNLGQAIVLTGLGAPIVIGAARCESGRRLNSRSRTRGGFDAQT
jgi:hypothetical protein